MAEPLSRPSTASGRRASLCLAAFVGVAVAFTYFDLTHLGFIWDDYIVLRARSWTELLRVWHGSWDATGLLPAFYRPLAVWSDTAAFALFGFNEVPLRITAFAELTTGSWLVGEIVRREVKAFWPGVYAAVLYALHPVVSTSAGPWWFEQNHRLSVICVAAAILAWQSRRADLRWRAWWPTHCWILVGSWFKEDVLVLAPILLLFQWWRARVSGDAPSPTFRFAAACAGAWLGWFALRWWLLGEIAGTPLGPPANGILRQLMSVAKGPVETFLWIRGMYGESSPAHIIATLVLLLSVGVGLMLWARGASARARLLFGYGVFAAALFNIPVSIASFATRYHLIAFGAALFLAGTALAITDQPWGTRRTRMRYAAALGGGVLVVCFGLASRANMQHYRPCTSANLALDAELREWLLETPQWRDSWIVPWLDEKAVRCSSRR